MMPPTHHRHIPSWYKHHPVLSPPRSEMRYAMRGLTDVTRMATAGVIGVGLLGTVAGILKK